MKYLFYITFTLLVLGCTSNEDIVLHSDIKEYQGIWRDTIFSASDVFVEDLTIKDNLIKYSLFNAFTHVILDTLSGTIVIGNENKIEWSGISPINNKTRHIYWDVLYLSPYQMRLYSNTYGECNYKKVHYTTIEEERIQDRLQNIVRDTLTEMFQYQDYLPLHKKDLIANFGDYNRLENGNEIAYFTYHPLFEKISFSESLDNDSIYSYSLTIKEENWQKSDSLVSSNYKKLREVNEKTEYIDADVLENSTNVIIINSLSHSIQVQPIKDYDYWPNVSHYLGKDIYAFMADYKDKYAYRYLNDSKQNLYGYSFMAGIDSVFSELYAWCDTDDKVSHTGISFFSKNKKQVIQNQLEELAAFFKKKYYFDREEVDNNGNKIFFFYPCISIDESPFEVKLSIIQKEEIVRKIYCVNIDFFKL